MDFLEQGRIHLPEDSLHVAFVGLIQFLNVPLLAVAGGPSVSVLSALLGGGLLLAAWEAGRRFGGGWAGVTALATVAGTTGVVLVAVTARVDTTLALYLWLGHYALLILGTRGWDPGWATRAAGILGLAIGVKHLSLPYGLALAPVVVFAAWGGLGGSLSQTLRRVGGMTVAAFSLGVPVLLKNQLLTGGALYPYFTRRRIPPWLADLLGDSGAPDALGPESFRFLIDVGVPFNLGDLIFSPGRLSVEVEAGMFFLSPLIALAPLVLLTRRPHLAVALLGPAMVYLAGVLSVSSQTNVRYLIPAVPALAVAAGVALGTVMRRISNRRWRAACCVLLLMAGICPWLRTGPGRFPDARTLAYMTGLETPREALRRGGVPDLVASTAMTRESVSPEGRVLLIAEARGSYFSRDVIQDNILTNWPLLSLAVEPERCLEGTGITHVLVNTWALDYYASLQKDLDMLRLESFDGFRGRCLALVEEREGQQLFRVR
jgi:hypothetical protein